MKAFLVDSIIRDIATLGAEARPLKTQLRTRWERPMADEQRRLCLLRRRLTELHVTLAHRRGRIHQRTAPAGASGAWDAEAHAVATAERVLARYAPEPLPTSPRATDGAQ